MSPRLVSSRRETNETLTESHTAAPPLSLPPSALSQPIPIDTDGDMKIDLIGMTPASRANASSPLAVWQNVWNASQPDSPVFSV